MNLRFGIRKKSLTEASEQPAKPTRGNRRNQLEEKISVLKAKLLGFSAKTTSQNNRLFQLEDRLSNSEAAADNLESIVEQAQSGYSRRIRTALG